MSRRLSILKGQSRSCAHSQDRKHGPLSWHRGRSRARYWRTSRRLNAPGRADMLCPPITDGFGPLSDLCTAPSDHLVGMRGKCWRIECLGGGGAGGVPRHPLRGACAHHRVERSDCGPRQRHPFRDRSSVYRAPEIGTPYGVTHAYFAIVSGSTSASKFSMMQRGEKNSPRSRECWSLVFEVESFCS